MRNLTISLILEAQCSNNRFTVAITGSDRSYSKNRVISFSLNEADKDYIRNVFNTDPTLTNTTLTKTSQRERYWLGETYAREFLQKVDRGVVTGSGFSASFGETDYVGVILPLASFLL